MKKALPIIFFILSFTCGYSQSNLQETKKTAQKANQIAFKKQKTDKKTVALRKNHAYYLANNKVNKLYKLSRQERKSAGLPPNKYFEQEWLLSMNPSLGRPTPENLTSIREELEKTRKETLINGRVPGDGTDNNWIERGPNNVGGRTRAIIFDPTDPTGNTVVAGGVSGGLWKNTNITIPTTSWIRIASLPEHLNVQNITIDPNDSSTWYVGTGESYVLGDANGNGIWKTTNAGVTWVRVFGGGKVSTNQNTVSNLSIIAPSNATAIRSYITREAAFGNKITSSFSASIELVNDGTIPTDDACSALLANSMTGKIALIRRGTCTFESKVLVAQNAGAVGVIVINNVSGGVTSVMAGSGLGASIPSIMISKEDGDLLVSNLTNLTGTFLPTNPGEFTGTSVSNIQFINDIAIKNNGGVSEIYAAVGDGYDASNSTFFNSTSYGLYKSINGGSTWTKLILPTTPTGNQTCPNDIEIAVGGKIWVSSTDSNTFKDGGGKIFVSTDDGASFITKHTIVGNGGGKRVEIEASNTTPDKLYVLAELKQANNATPTKEIQLLLTTNGFATTPTTLPLPPCNDSRDATYGFTGGQAFYNLHIESDPTNDANIYVGGLNIHKSTNNGSTWVQISDFFAGNSVHSDQHAMVFNPLNNNSALFGNDGGVYYCGSLSAATNTSAAITSRNNGFNVTQFVGLAVMPNGVSGVTDDFFVAGSQDNGSNYFPFTLSTTTGAPMGISGSNQIQGGDGGMPLFKQNASSNTSAYYVTNYVYNDNMNVRNLDGTIKKILNSGSENFGQFYSAMALSSVDDIVYSDATNNTSKVYQIRRYSSYLAGTAPVKTLLTNSLLNAYPTALNVGKTTSTTLYVGTANSKLLKVVNANGTGIWSNISGSGFVGSISDIEFGANDNQIFVTLKNYGVTNIWYTLDGGTNWYSIEGNLPDLPVNCILQNPLNTVEIIIGTDLGVWTTNTFNPNANTTQALNWNQSYNGMSSVKVTDLDLQPNSPTVPTAYNVFASTYGRGVFSGSFSTTSLPISPNDNCPQAITLNVTGDFATSSIVGTILDATASEISTPSIPVPGCASYVGGDVWYSVVVPASGQITIETGSESGGFDNTGLAIYNGSCNSLSLVACDDDSSLNGAFSLISLTGRTPGEVLYARVWRFNNALPLVGSNSLSTSSRNIDAIGEFRIGAYSSLLNTTSFENSGLLIYPNPIKDKLTLSYTKEMSDVSIYNLTGQEVISIKHINARQMQLDMSKLSSGSYLLKVTVDSLEKTLKIIKQ